MSDWFRGFKNAENWYLYKLSEEMRVHSADTEEYAAKRLLEHMMKNYPWQFIEETEEFLNGYSDYIWNTMYRTGNCHRSWV